MSDVISHKGVVRKVGERETLVEILSKLSALLAENQIGILAISTYNTDYILTKADDYSRALEVLSDAGYQIV